MERDDPVVSCMVLADASLVPHARAALEAAGIPHFVKNEGVQELVGWGSVLWGFNPITGAPVIMVQASRRAEAAALLGELVTRVQAPAEAEVRASTRPTVCRRCRGTLESEAEDAALSHCYHCGWPLDAEA